MKIRHRIAMWVAGAGFLASLTFTFIVFIELREEPLEILDSHLESIAVALAAEMSGEQSPFVNGNAIVQSLSKMQYWIKVYGQDLAPLLQSDLTRAVSIPLERKRRDHGYTFDAHIPNDDFNLHPEDLDKIPFRVRIIKVHIAGVPRLIQIAKPIEELRNELSRLIVILGIGLTVSTGLLLIVSYFFAGRIIRPISNINRLTREINEKTLGERIPLSSSHDELNELSTSLNLMFDRLHYSFTRQKFFISNASHELRNPVAMLRLFFEEAIQRQDIPENIQSQLTGQLHRVLRMDRLIKTLLELSVLESKDYITLETFSLSDLVRSVLDDFLPLMTNLDIQVEADLPEQLNIQGDKDKIQRLLINIVDNAVKYNKVKGEIQLKIIEKDKAINLSLFNTGQGVPNDELEKVFDQFYRVEKSRSLEHGGAGLGLAIVKEIVRLHNGEVYIESKPGTWTRINIIIPKVHTLK